MERMTIVREVLLCMAVYYLSQNFSSSIFYTFELIIWMVGCQSKACIGEVNKANLKIFGISFVRE